MKRITFFYLLFFSFLMSSCGSAKHTSVDSEEKATPSKNEVVNWGYGEVEKSKTSRSVSRLVNEDDEASKYVDMYEYLRGRVPGVNVIGKTILIRGVNTINGSTDPLIILDGVPINDLDQVLPADVSTVDVLKGPDASVYGVRGANGVIIITTKNGRD